MVSTEKKEAALRRQGVTFGSMWNVRTNREEYLAYFVSFRGYERFFGYARKGDLVNMLLRKHFPHILKVLTTEDKKKDAGYQDLLETIRYNIE